MHMIGIYGAGKNGKELAPILKTSGLLRCFIDGDVNKNNTSIDGVAVLGPDQFVEKYPNDKIVIASSAYEKEIEGELLKRGKKNDEDYWLYNRFKGKILHEMLYKEFGKIYVELAQICVTERCTLKCKKCAHACNLVPMNQKDMSLADIKVSADNFFDKVDVVGEFVLIGGEPMLNDNLAEAIDYIGGKYRDKMLTFAVTTNGTIVPNDKLRESIKRNKVTVRVSDYSETLPNLSGRYKELYASLEGLDVAIWETNSKDSWFDYGFGEVDNGNDANVLKGIFRECNTPCREIQGNKYYYCVMARSISENMFKIKTPNYDYLQLSADTSKEEFLEFEVNGPKKGYLDMCRYCRGGSAEKYRIPAAEQEKNR